MVMHLAARSAQLCAWDCKLDADSAPGGVDAGEQVVALRLGGGALGLLQLQVPIHVHHCAPSAGSCLKIAY